MASCKACGPSPPGLADGNERTLPAPPPEAATLHGGDEPAVPVSAFQAWFSPQELQGPVAQGTAVGVPAHRQPGGIESGLDSVGGRGWGGLTPPPRQHGFPRPRGYFSMRAQYDALGDAGSERGTDGGLEPGRALELSPGGAPTPLTPAHFSGALAPSAFQTVLPITLFVAASSTTPAMFQTPSDPRGAAPHAPGRPEPTFAAAPVRAAHIAQGEGGDGLNPCVGSCAGGGWIQPRYVKYLFTLPSRGGFDLGTLRGPPSRQMLDDLALVVYAIRAQVDAMIEEERRKCSAQSSNGSECQPTAYCECRGQPWMYGGYEFNNPVLGGHAMTLIKIQMWGMDSEGVARVRYRYLPLTREEWNVYKPRFEQEAIGVIHLKGEASELPDFGTGWNKRGAGGNKYTVSVHIGGRCSIVCGLKSGVSLSSGARVIR